MRKNASIYNYDKKTEERFDREFSNEKDTIARLCELIDRYAELSSNINLVGFYDVDDIDYLKLLGEEIYFACGEFVDLETFDISKSSFSKKYFKISEKICSSIKNGNSIQGISRKDYGLELEQLVKYGKEAIKEDNKGAILDFSSAVLLFENIMVDPKIK